MNNKDFVNIASHLPKMAELKPSAMAVVMACRADSAGRILYSHYTLDQLNRASDDIANGLAKFNIERGTRTVLMVTPSLDFFALTFALFKVGAIPVMVDPGIGIKGLGQCLAEAEPEAFIGITKAHIARCLFGWAKKTLKTFVTVGKKLFWGGPTLTEVQEAGKGNGPYEMAKTEAGETAAILFTSGSTGVAKGAVYTHGMFDTQVRMIREVYGIEPGEMDLSTFPLFALFGPALGMTSIIPEMDASKPMTADPAKLVQPILDFGATNMFASPALIEKIGRYGVENDIKLHSLRRVISAGAPARNDSLERFSKLLKDGVNIYTPYGATECLPVSNIGSIEILQRTAPLSAKGKGNCVGKPIPAVQLKIIKITDEPIEKWTEDLVMPTGQIGEIVVTGSLPSASYYNRPESTKQAKIPDTENGGFYHRMGDVGYVDDNGDVWFCGRKNHRVVTENGTMFTIPCEALFNTHPKVFRTAIVGIGEKGEQKPLLCVELNRGVGESEQDSIKKELMDIAAKNPMISEIETILFHPAFPMDPRHNAKIFREKLTIWAGGKLK